MTDKSVDTIFAELAEPFRPQAIKFRAGHTFDQKGGGKRCLALAYIDARDVIDRLNEVVGRDGWYEMFRDVGSIIICRTFINLYNDPDRDKWPWREDGAGLTKMEAEKGGLSAARKRSASMWGIGLYLYSMGRTYCEYDPMKKRIPDNEIFRLRSELPKWAKPGGATKPTHEEAAEREVEQLEQRHEATPDDAARIAEIDEFAGRALDDKLRDNLTVPQRKQFSKRVRMCAVAAAKIFHEQGHDMDVPEKMAEWLRISPKDIPEHMSPQKSGITDEQLMSAAAQAAAYLTAVTERAKKAAGIVVDEDDDLPF